MLKPLKMVLGVVLLLLCVGLASQMLSEAEVFAQTVDTAWVRRYNGSGNGGDEPTGLAIDDSGYVYVTGGIYTSGSGYDYGTIKYYPNGDTAWVRSYNGPGNDEDAGCAIAVDDSGYVLVTGYSWDSGTLNDYTTIKYRPNGDTVWVRRYNGPASGDDLAWAIAVDDSGNVYVTGQSPGSGTLNDYATIKYHPNGDTAWVRRYDGPANSQDCASCIAVDSSSNVYVTGYSVGSGTSWDYATIKYYSDGDTAWVRRYNGPVSGNDQAKAMVVDDSANVYATGQSPGSGTWDDYATIKYQSNGDTAWVRRYDGPEDSTDYAYAIAVDGSGNVYVTGYSISSGSGRDYATIKYLPDGDTAWVVRYNGRANDHDEAWALAVDNSGNVYVTGRSVGSGTLWDYATIKYQSNGDTAWVRRYNGPAGNGNDHAVALAVDSSGNVYVTGESKGDGTGYDYCTIKYSPKSTDVKDETENRGGPSEFALSQNYPNPFNPTTKIEFTLAKSGFVTLQIYDILGRKVRTLVSEHLSSGYKSVLWDGKNDDEKDVASGVYFYQLKVGDLSQPKKMLLLK
jgi:dienelactone hydrolase